MIEISTVEYDAELITEDGTHYPLNDALLSLQWEEQINELSQRVTMTVANVAIGGAWLNSLAKINCLIFIYGKWEGGEKTLLFDGTIWEWQYVSGTQKELTLTAYDRLIRLQQSKDFQYYSPGMTTQAIIGSICNEWNIQQALIGDIDNEWSIPLEYKWARSVTHEKKVFNAVAVSDMIIELLEEVKQKTGEPYVAYFRDGKLQITGYGTNAERYKFDTSNTVSTTDKLTIDDLVTRVRIIGKQDDEGRAPVDNTVDGDTQYGVLQEIIRRDGDKTIEAATQEALALIKQRGKPKEIIQINVPDVPVMRKGDTIEVGAGNLNGLFSVEGVSHNATERQMTLTVSRFDEPEAAFPSSPAADGENTVTHAFQKGDAVIVNGVVYADSNGDGEGRIYTDYRSVISIVAPLARARRYYVSQVGWVSADELTKG
jgi:hypothetical protein